MENATFILTSVTNGIICLVACHYLVKKNRSGSITKKQTELSYVVFALLAGVISGTVIIDPLYDLFQGLGFIQDFGHGGYAITLILNMGLSLILLVVGIIVINWKKVIY